MSHCPPRMLRQRERGRSDRAFVVIDGQRVKLGVWGSKRAEERYRKVIASHASPPKDHSATHLGVATKKNGRIARRLAEIVRVTQDGDDGINGVFPAEKHVEVHKIVRLRRRPRHSHAIKQAMAVRTRENFARRDRGSEGSAHDRTKKSTKWLIVEDAA